MAQRWGTSSHSQPKGGRARSSPGRRARLEGRGEGAPAPDCGGPEEPPGLSARTLPWSAHVAMLSVMLVVVLYRRAEYSDGGHHMTVLAGIDQEIGGDPPHMRNRI